MSTITPIPLRYTDGERRGTFYRGLDPASLVLCDKAWIEDTPGSTGMTKREWWAKDEGHEPRLLRVDVLAGGQA